MNFIKENWTEIKETVKREYNLSSISYDTWIEPLQVYKVENNMVIILIPSDKGHALNYINSKYKSFFQVTISEMFNSTYDISFILESDVAHDVFEEAELSSNPSIHNVSYENANLNPKSANLLFAISIQSAPSNFILLAGAITLISSPVFNNFIYFFFNS